ncbi:MULTISPECIES: GNAT family N-acetyltransferase [Sphingomonadaceae]|uniref:GNAT family N-acetyltransferase n=1 Tax=Blastomonas fulva TaxID=1550728 RepID=UPI004033CBEC
MKYLYSMAAGNDVSEDERFALKRLFDEHYGEWSLADKRSGTRVKTSLKMLADLLDRDDAYLLMARHGADIVGYAIGSRFAAQDGFISWVTQLVVHSEHQRQGIATRLLQSAWAFSDDFAWGLASANPFAIRALETARFRRCEPAVIAENRAALAQVLPQIAKYLGGLITVDSKRAVIDTAFPVSHATVPQSIATVSADVPWTLGRLDEGEEWLASVFRSQQPRALTGSDLDALFDAGGSVAAEAYERMAESTKDNVHPWMAHAASEVDVVIELLALEPGASVLDLGCGNGRHARELAKRGFAVTAVDRSQGWLAQAGELAAADGVSIDFRFGDARDLDLGRTFDAVICLYDVVGSFRREADNRAILATLRRHLPIGGTFALSAMNRVVAERLALFHGDVEANPDLVHDIPPSETMQETGGIWSPEGYLADTCSGLVYRRERFGKLGSLPIELLVCDRRYRSDELDVLCREAGLQATTIRPVRLGAWHEALPEDDIRAKEVLCTGTAVTVSTVP